ncbi:Paired box protein [Aphelenchoides bicaudatus]|nr:Paired box protein [Aphelenchoides bicaudatus]
MIFQKTGLFSAGKIGGSKPKKSIPQVISAIETYKKLRPNIFSWEIREQLVNDGICKADNILSISSINRIIRTKLNNCSPASTPNQTNH